MITNPYFFEWILFINTHSRKFRLYILFPANRYVQTTSKNIKDDTNSISAEPDAFFVSSMSRIIRAKFSYFSSKKRFYAKNRFAVG